MLPKINYPIIDIKLPSTKEIIKFRPIIVKEEKLLLMAKSSESDTDIFVTIKQIVNNCCLDETFDVDKIALYELEYIFLKLRGYSIGNKIEVTYKDIEDEKKYNVVIDLNDVKIVYPDTNPNSNIIDIDESTKLVLNYPPASLYSDTSFLNSEADDIVIELISNCISYIQNNDNKIKPNISNEKEKQELIDFLENLESTVYEKIQKFFYNAPHMEYTVSYENSLGNKKDITLRKLNDFFMLR